MLSWRGVADVGGIDVDGFLMLLPWDDGGLIPGASPKTTVQQQVMQIDERRNGGARQPNLHTDARGRIQHPSRDYRDYAGRHLDMNDRTTRALLDGLSSHGLTK